MNRLGDILRFAGVPERFERPGEEQYVTLRVRGGGAVERVIKDGKVPVPFTGYRVRAGQFIYSRIDARNGAYGIIPAELDRAVVSKDFPVFDILDNRVVPEYLLHFMRAGTLQNQVKAASFGATNRQRISEDTFARFQVALPPLAEQRRVASLPDHAASICATWRDLLAHLEALSGSIFRSMFDKNSHRRASIGSFATVRSGSTPPRSNPAHYGGGIPWVKTTEVRGEEIRVTSETVSDAGVRAARLKVFPTGSVVVAMYGQGKTRGQSAVLGIPATVNQACAVIQPNERFDSTFLQTQLLMSYERLRGEAEGGNQPNLSLARVAGFEVLLPDIRLQKDFRERADHIRNVREGVLAALASDNALFASLQSRAFRGEL